MAIDTKLEYIKKLFEYRKTKTKRNNLNLFFISLLLYKLFLFIFILFQLNLNNNKKPKDLNEYDLIMTKQLNFNIYKKINNKINIGIYTFRLKNGGRARVTALLINYLYKIKIFNINLFTVLNKEDDEYYIPKEVKREIIRNNLIINIRKKKLDILIYELENLEEMHLLNNLKNLKIIYYMHASSFDWIYYNYSFFKSLYKEYKNSTYIVSIVPFDNDLLHKKWGIKSILMNNFITYNYNYIIQSKLVNKKILMLGRGNDVKKRFQKGILSMEYIIQEINNCELSIISDLKYINNLLNLVNNLKLGKNIKFLGYISYPESYLPKYSLNLFPSITEAFPMVLTETKLYSIPSILLGLDYILLSKKGTVIIYDDSPESLSIEAIKLLTNYNLRQILGKEGRKSMKKYNNNLLLLKWNKLILSVFNGYNYFLELIKKDEKMPNKEIEIIINNQIKLLKRRKIKFNNITINKFENFSYLENLN